MSGSDRQAWPSARFRFGDRVTKVRGSSWNGRVVGWYSTGLTPIGWAVESEREPGSVQIYPDLALVPAGRVEVERQSSGLKPLPTESSLGVRLGDHLVETETRIMDLERENERLRRRLAQVEQES